MIKRLLSVIILKRSVLFILFFFVLVEGYTQLPQGFSLLEKNAKEIVLDIKYSSRDNFMGRVIEGYDRKGTPLTNETIAALKSAQKAFNALGFGIKLFDGYRPQKAVDDFIEWGKNEADTLTKNTFYPDLEKKELFAQGYIAQRSGHSRGSTVDITLIYLNEENDLQEVDMGGRYDFFGERSNFDFEDITKEQKQARILLRKVMMKNGFVPYAMEWWHFTLKDEPFPMTYFDF